MSIGENIKRNRKLAGLTQAQLAEKLGVTQQNIAMFESDKTNIKFTTLSKISKALDVSVIDLLESTKIGNLISDFGVETYLQVDDNDELNLLGEFRMLNPTGKAEAVKRVEELTHIEKYVIKEEPSK